MRSFRRGTRPLVVGHRGAAAIAPENTLESLAAGIDAGADVVEFDVGTGLLLGHSPRERAERPVALSEALAFLRERDAGIHVDLKRVGIEEAVVAEIRRHGLEERAYVSSTSARSLRRLAALAPRLGRAVGYPNDRYGASRLRWPRPLTAGAAASARAIVPVRVPALLALSRANVLALHHTLISPRVVRVTHERGASILGWTANDPAVVERLAAAGVDGIVSDDPRMALAVLATLERP
jgi:glycerophosphoryl diester phosphodiesterase